MLLYLIAPLLLIAMITAGVRFATHADQTREDRSEAVTREAWKAARTGSGKAARPRPKPPVFHPTDAATQAAIESSIRGQLDALRANNFGASLEYATPNTRASMSPERFGMMIRSGYAPMLTAKSVDFLPASVQGRPGYVHQALVQVRLRGDAGVTTPYMYSLVSDGGKWYVQAVMNIPQPPGGGEDFPRRLPPGMPIPVPGDL